MPKWNIHLEAARRANNKLKYREDKLEEFLVGSILPDINNGWLVPEVQEKYKHDTTHIDSVNTEAVRKFALKYRDQIKEKKPIFMGYLLHLCTDMAFNDNFYKKIIGTDIQEMNKDEIRKLKQGDFAVFDKKYPSLLYKFQFLEKDVEAAQEIQEVRITKNDLEFTEKYFERERNEEKDGKYVFCSDEMLEKYLLEAVNFFIREFC